LEKRGRNITTRKEKGFGRSHAKFKKGGARAT